MIEKIILFSLKEDKEQFEKEQLLKEFEAADNEVKIIKNKTKKKELKRTKRRIIRRFKQLSEYQLATYSEGIKKTTQNN